MDKVRTNNNIVVYRCRYHVVWCPKYRRTVIDGNADTRLKEIIREVCTEPNTPSGPHETPIRLHDGWATPDPLRRGSVSSPRLKPGVSTEGI